MPPRALPGRSQDARTGSRGPTAGSTGPPSWRRCGRVPRVGANVRADTRRPDARARARRGSVDRDPRAPSGPQQGRRSNDAMGGGGGDDAAAAFLAKGRRHRPRSRRCGPRRSSPAAAPAVARSSPPAVGAGRAVPQEDPFWAVPVLFLHCRVGGHLRPPHPRPADPGQQPRTVGATVYSTNCATCHGPTGGSGAIPPVGDGGDQESFPQARRPRVAWVALGSPVGPRPGQTKLPGGRRSTAACRRGRRRSPRDLMSVVLHEAHHARPGDQPRRRHHLGGRLRGDPPESTRTRPTPPQPSSTIGRPTRRMIPCRSLLTVRSDRTTATVSNSTSSDCSQRARRHPGRRRHRSGRDRRRRSHGPSTTTTTRGRRPGATPIRFRWTSTSVQGCDSMAGLVVPPTVKDFSDRGDQNRRSSASVTFTLPSDQVGRSCPDRGSPALAEGAKVVTSSPLWKLNPRAPESGATDSVTVGWSDGGATVGFVWGDRVRCAWCSPATDPRSSFGRRSRWLRHGS